MFITRGTAVRRVRGLGPDALPLPPEDDGFPLLVAMLTGVPLVPGNSVELVLDRAVFTRLFDDLRQAQISIVIQIYFAGAGRVLDTISEILCERAGAGVAVYVLYDAFGAPAMGGGYARRLREAGARMVPFRPLRFRNLWLIQNRAHTRAIVIDSRIGWTGGFGFDDKWLGNDTHPAWRDSAVRFHGPAVLQLIGAFAASWSEATGELYTGRAVPVYQTSGVASAAMLCTSPTLGSTPAERFLAFSIAGAQRRLYITNAYFAPDGNFVELLAGAARRGVDVRLLVGGPSTDVAVARSAAHARYSALFAVGVRIWEYLPTTLHAKAFVVDGLWSSVGTMNFDNRSLALNDEATLMVRDAPFAERLEEQFAADLRDAAEVHPQVFAQRSWIARLGEWGANLSPACSDSALPRRTRHQLPDVHDERVRPFGLRHWSRLLPLLAPITLDARFDAHPQFLGGLSMTELSAFRLDPANQCLWRRNGSSGEQRVLLTPTEFRVLDHLVEHAGELVTHRQLLDALWPGTAIEPQVVKNKIFHLRKMLEDEPKRPRYIETLPRRGYRFVGTLERSSGAQAEVSGSRLVGRDAALADLWQAFRSAMDGKVQLVFLTGEAGIGKTTLADEFQRQVAASNRAVRFGQGQCVGFGSREAFYPVLEAVGRLCHGPDAGRVVDTLALEAPTWLVQFPALLTRQHRETLRQEILGATRERMLREICEALAAVSARSPVLLILEDLHWGDSSTLDLLSALARHRGAARIMLIATYRPADVARSTCELDALKRDLVARHLAREVPLSALTDAEIAEYLAEGQSMVTVPEELPSLLHRHTEGNPLFMIAVLEHMLEAGLIERAPGAWRLRSRAAEIAVHVPENLRQMIGAQIERLSVLEQRVLEMGAIAGMTFRGAIAALAADLDPGAFDECCEALARRNHILRLAGTEELPDGQVVQRYRFVHALYREVLYERQAPARRAMLHRRRAERTAEVFAATLDDVAAELAHHFELGADWTRAVKYLRRVADVAGKQGAPLRATTNLEHALWLAARLAGRERVNAEVGILDALVGISLHRADPGTLDRVTLLRELAARHGLIDVEVGALTDMAAPLGWVSSERSMEVVDQALRLSERQPDPLMRARTRVRCMVRRIWARGWHPEDAETCRTALADIHRHGTREDVAWDTIESSYVELYSTHYRMACRDTVESLAVLKEAGDEHSHLSYTAARRLSEYTVSWSHILLGEWGAALRGLDAAIALAKSNADLYGREVLQLLRCWTQLLAMDFDGARAGCASVSPLERPLQRFPRHMWLPMDGAAAAGLGDHEAALERLLAAREEMDRAPQLLDWYWRLLQRWSLAGLWLSRGELSRAREEAELLAANATATEERTWQGLAWDVNAKIALAGDDPRQARDLIERGLTAIEGVEAPVATWQVHATAAEVFELLGDSVRAQSHWDLSRDTVLTLAASLDTYEASRRTFLTSRAVARVLDCGAGARTPLHPSHS